VAKVQEAKEQKAKKQAAMEQEAKEQGAMKQVTKKADNTPKHEVNASSSIKEEDESVNVSETLSEPRSYMGYYGPGITAPTSPTVPNYPTGLNPSAAPFVPGVPTVPAQSLNPPETLSGRRDSNVSSGSDMGDGTFRYDFEFRTMQRKMGRTGFLQFGCHPVDIWDRDEDWITRAARLKPPPQISKPTMPTMPTSEQGSGESTESIAARMTRAWVEFRETGDGKAYKPS
jgi:hypothetical protein